MFCSHVTLLMFKLFYLPHRGVQTPGSSHKCSFRWTFSHNPPRTEWRRQEWTCCSQYDITICLCFNCRCDYCLVYQHGLGASALAPSPCLLTLLPGNSPSSQILVRPSGTSTEATRATKSAETMKNWNKSKRHLKLFPNFLKWIFFNNLNSLPSYWKVQI